LKKTLKTILDKQPTAVGIFVQDIRSPFVIQLAAAGGLDLVIIDLEHGLFNRETVSDLIKMARATGVLPIVRTINAEYESLCPWLDAGARGLMIPRVRNIKMLKRAINHTKYPPEGTRGIIRMAGHSDYADIQIAPYIKAQNRFNFLVPQIEVKEILENVEEIATLKDIDTVFIGPGDLSLSLGIVGQPGHPDLLRSIERIIKICEEYEVNSGIAVGSIVEARYWLDKGVRFVTCGSASAILLSRFQQLAQELKQSFKYQ